MRHTATEGQLHQIKIAIIASQRFPFCNGKTMQEYSATVKLNANQVVLRSGVYCELKAAHCVDIEGGNTYWDTIPDDSCKGSSYGVLFDGYAIKMQDSTDAGSQTVYSITTQDTTFALASRGEVKACGYPLVKTEHPKLFIFETFTDLSIFKKIHNPANTDIFTYMNSKFVYVEKHFRAQLNQLYRNMLYQQCYLEQKMLQNALAIATQSPDIFAYHFMKASGYTSILAGEVIHIIKCVPVEVQVARTPNCYTQLPVIRENETYYLAPQTHLLLRQGTQVNCNPLAPVMYQLGEDWYKMMPNPIKSIPPTTLKPMTKPEWKYTSPGALATSGIYSQSDLDEFKDHILFPAERPAVLNTMARAMMGHSATIHGGSFTNLLDEASLEKLATSTWNKIWGRFLIFGNISAGIMGIFLIFRFIKLLLDTILHGFALHSIYGCSCYLIGALWDSLTQLLILIGGRKTTKTEAAIELQTVNVGPTHPPIITEPSSSTNQTEYQRLYPLSPQKDNTPYTFELKS
ncbi:uncharacterized protein LOC112589174 [Harpegnathos saltator]|uniref:uncharacterized protein LOC112589174 n=1 Tax=Harpegnathos saltator TaxID=610380 RepID=UPI000DBEE606|nr:uncharacterized protein LOC112589174 [Harpegnathos saltator]